MNRRDVPIEDGRIFRVDCCIEANMPDRKRFGIAKTKINKRRNFKLDTGASITCVFATDIGIYITEEEFRKEYPNAIMVQVSGIDTTSKIYYYSFQVENFVIEGIDLGSVPIYITFNSKAQKSLFGADLLRLLNINFDFDNKLLTLSKTNEFLKFRDNHLRLTIKDMYKMGIYSINDVKGIDIQIILEASAEDKDSGYS